MVKILSKTSSGKPFGKKSLNSCNAYTDEVDSGSLKS